MAQTPEDRYVIVVVPEDWDESLGLGHALLCGFGSARLNGRRANGVSMTMGRAGAVKGLVFNEPTGRKVEGQLVMSDNLVEIGSTVVWNVELR